LREVDATACNYQIAQVASVEISDAGRPGSTEMATVWF